MKKLLFIATIILFPLILQAQKVEYDKINRFNKRIMYTSWEKVNWDSDGQQLEVSFFLEGNDMSMLLNWQCKEMLGAERDSKISLYFDDKTIVELYNKAFSVSGVGKVRTKDVGSTTMGVQLDAKGSIEQLNTIAQKQLQAIRITTTSGDMTFQVQPEEALAIAQLYEVYEKAVLSNKK